MDNLLWLWQHLGIAKAVLSWISLVVGLLHALGVPYAVIVGPPVALFLLFGLAFMFYVALVSMRDHWQEMGLVIKIVEAPWIVAFAPIDFVINIVWGFLVSWDIPREWFLTRRLKRYKAEGLGASSNMIVRLWHHWHLMQATWLCNELNVFDKRGHC